MNENVLRVSSGKEKGLLGNDGFRKSNKTRCGIATAAAQGTKNNMVCSRGATSGFLGIGA